jgi:hypothetical protein
MATQRWQYRTVFLWADAERVRDYLLGFMTDDIPKYAPESLMPQLDALGNEGWELVHMQPVYVGKNADVLVHFSGVDRAWSNAYFCVFKRPRA